MRKRPLDETPAFLADWSSRSFETTAIAGVHVLPPLVTAASLRSNISVISWSHHGQLSACFCRRFVVIETCGTGCSRSSFRHITLCWYVTKRVLLWAESACRMHQVLKSSRPRDETRLTSALDAQRLVTARLSPTYPRLRNSAVPGTFHLWHLQPCDKSAAFSGQHRLNSGIWDADCPLSLCIHIRAETSSSTVDVDEPPTCITHVTVLPWDYETCSRGSLF